MKTDVSLVLLFTGNNVDQHDEKLNSVSVFFNSCNSFQPTTRKIRFPGFLTPPAICRDLVILIPHNNRIFSGYKSNLIGFRQQRIVGSGNGVRPHRAYILSNANGKEANNTIWLTDHDHVSLLSLSVHFIEENPY